MKHLAIIMDGNRRWATRQGLRPWRGHDEGAKVIRRVIEFCVLKKISYLSLYAFSLENFKRTPQELAFLFDVMVTQAENNLPLFLEQGIRVRFIGDRVLFPEKVRPTIERLERETEHLSTLHMSILFCYGAQQEIVHSVKNMVRKIQNGLMTEDDITEQTLSNFLWTSGMPSPDLIIRTGGRQRLSNFLLYQAAYSELYFLDCMWPELQTTQLEQAVAYFEQSQRNFGI